MRGISIRAILIAVIAALAAAMLAIVLGELMVVVIAMVTNPDVATLPQKFLELERSFAASIIIFSGILAAIGAGYVAGRIAKRSFLSHGLLAATAWTLAGTVYGFFFPGSSRSASEVPAALNIILTIGSPILGTLGGYLAEMREAQLAALPIEQRDPPGFWSGACTALGWVLALPVAALAYVCSLKVAFAIVGIKTGLVFAVVFAVLAGTAAVRSSQRTIAAYVFISLAILIPAEELVRHAFHDGVRFIHGFYFVLNVIGTGFAYQSLQLAFPEQFGSFAGNWWWLSYHGYARWTPLERNARRALAAACGVTAILLFVAFHVVLKFFVADTGTIIPFEGLIAMILGLWLARPICSGFLPQAIALADSHARARLSMEVRRGLSLRKLATIIASTMVVVVAIALVSS
jgi:hypothetical protein